ncbi:cation:proton antiporter [Paludisphaera borealis]|uniref:High-affinity Na(+)/H(+) antiporter NhaS3 n=1 Tax=Paludisphaera borealis TaxID=1387353 RepID=A0A1U7CP05_9BACT|nr:cation:proton antiporter [Paludisphaera borealis]APW60613.1 High-affinity Na(+)/H(+) antiporter NhaS3 [Paludisphaera borealis]
MHHLEVSELFAMLVVMLVAAKIVGELAQRIGQPAVLGELIAGILVGRSVLGLVDPHVETIHMLSELGVVILLLAIGLETDLRAMMRVGGTSLAVAVIGVVLPFGLGYAACRLLGLDGLTSIMAGATLTATSVGITARVLSDLGRLRDVEGQIILGAAVIDDILGLVILTVVGGMVGGGSVSVGAVAWTTGAAFGFLAVTLVVGHLVLPWLVRLASRINLPGTPTIFALTLALGLAWLAEKSGSALIIGAFAAGVLLAKTPRAHEIEKGITTLGHFFVPLFFVAVGASVDLSALNPLDSDSRWALVVGGALIVCGVVGKLAAGYAPFWFRGDKRVVGVGMIPRGEVGLIFAQMGLDQGVFDAGMFGGVTLMVIVTTFLAPPLLKLLLTSKNGGRIHEEPEGIEDLVTEA